MAQVPATRALRRRSSPAPSPSPPPLASIRTRRLCKARALGLINGLDEPRRRKAILETSKTGDKNQTEAWRDNVVIPYAGISAMELTDAQLQQLVALIELYVGNMDDGHARVKMEEVLA